MLGWLAYRELDDVLGLTEMAGDVLARRTQWRERSARIGRVVPAVDNLVALPDTM
jgi:hypothetical protein